MKRNNRPSGISIKYFSRLDNKNANYYHFKPSINLLETNNVDILIYYPYEFNLDIEKIKEKYDEYIFEASTYFQVSKYENMTCYVYVKKNKNVSKLILYH